MCILSLLKWKKFCASNRHLFSLISTVSVFFLLYFCIHQKISFTSAKLISLSTKSTPCPPGWSDGHAELLIIPCDMSPTEMGCGWPRSCLRLYSAHQQSVRQGCHARRGDPDLSSLILSLGCCLYVRQLADS